jgi:hypothetical protein
MTCLWEAWSSAYFFAGKNKYLHDGLVTLCRNYWPRHVIACALPFAGRAPIRTQGRPMDSSPKTVAPTPPHPRVLGWVGTTALAMGGSNQMIFLITALFVG